MNPMKPVMQQISEVLKDGWPDTEALLKIPFGARLDKLGGRISFGKEFLGQLAKLEVPSSAIDALSKIAPDQVDMRPFRRLEEFRKFLKEIVVNALPAQTPPASPEAGAKDEPDKVVTKVLAAMLGEHGAHVRQVVDSMNKLLSEAPIHALCDYDKDDAQDDMLAFLEVVQKKIKGLFVNPPFSRASADAFLRIAALFHDIGKLIHRDRHSLEGHHYVAHVDPEETKRLKDALGEDWFQLLCDIIVHHDLFGVVGTGEASAPVLTNVLPLRSVPVEEQQTILALLLMLNIADISAVVPLTSRKAATVAEDWDRLCKLLKQSDGDRQRFVERLVKEEQTTERAILRIRRILTERAPKELIARFGSFGDVERHTERMLRIIVGTQLTDFVSDFALVCKLDYALRFVQNLEGYAEKKGISPQRVIQVVTRLLKELVQSYSSLTRRPDRSRRRIGIQLSGWTRTPEITDGLVRLLFSEDMETGLAWAAEEATAWYFE